jgi:hypothetical protein
VIKVRRQFYPVLYPLWALLCAAMFGALLGEEDRARPAGRLTPAEAKTIALAHLRSIDEERFGNYHVIDANAYRDVSRGERVWIVICDSTPRSALAKAVVVDLDTATGSVVRTRRPVSPRLEEFPIR